MQKCHHRICCCQYIVSGRSTIVCNVAEACYLLKREDWSSASLAITVWLYLSHLHPITLSTAEQHEINSKLHLICFSTSITHACDNFTMKEWKIAINLMPLATCKITVSPTQSDRPLVSHFLKFISTKLLWWRDALQIKYSACLFSPYFCMLVINIARSSYNFVALSQVYQWLLLIGRIYSYISWLQKYPTPVNAIISNQVIKLSLTTVITSLIPWMLLWSWP